jgi:CRISPR-associated protein Cmr4
MVIVQFRTGSIMDVKKQILYIYTETPMHVGTGVGLGAVDMPIQREKHTGYPIIQASGVKGALRDTAELILDRQEIKSIFGGASGDKGEDFAGAMSPSDARILLFPVRALNGVFVWITSPTVLERFRQETETADTPNVPEIEKNGLAQVSNTDRIINGQIMLEEYTYPAQFSDLAQAWANHFAVYALRDSTGDYWKQRLYTHLVILTDDDFRDFVKYSTDIVTRIHVDDVKKTVKTGALFTQELLPADSLLYSMVHITNSRDGKEDSNGHFIPKMSVDDVVKRLHDAIRDRFNDRLQIGGDETVGRGRVRLNWQGVE